MKHINALRLLAAAAAVIVAVAGAAQPATGAGRATYIVALSDPPLAAHAAARMHGLGLSPQDERRAVRSALRSADSGDYLRRLDAARANVLHLATQRFNRALAPNQVYRYAANGMALDLSSDEAQRIAGLPGVAAVRRERVLHLDTDAGPQWIGANQIWNGVAAFAGTKGEGIVIGVIDTGINPGHPSFAAHGADGYNAVNPRGHFYGLCASGQAQCNAKLVGIYDFTSEGTKGVDSTGHGSHTAGIAAGNAMSNALQGYTVSLSRNVSGVAPHATLITYKACNAAPIDASSDGTCAESALVAAIDQATADQVDVINYSIGGDAYDPYQLLTDPTTDAYAMFQARSAGVVLAVSAGNDGPNAHTIGEPGNVPWVLGVANASHNRRFVNSIGAFTGAANAPADLAGQGYTAGYGPAAIVYAGNYGNALCGVGDTQGVTPDGGSNPFPAGTFHGEIVICDRGIYARVEKGYNVKAAGAGGYILANTASDGESIVSDDHFLPAVHLGYSEGQALKAWVAGAGAHGGTISGVSAELADSYGDILDASSSRGPYGFGGGVLKPDLTAPGDNILSAARTGSGLALLSGTSMSGPHVAGAAALVLAVHPDWTPAQVESTLTGTALAGVRMQDGTTPASPLDAGAGRVQPAAAVRAGLYLPLATADFFAGSGSLANPTAHGDLTQLNRTGLENENCFQACSFTRKLTDISGGGTWQVSSSGTAGVAFDVQPSQFTLAAGASQTLAITIDVSDPALAGKWASGRILLHKTGGGSSATDMALTAAVYATPGAMPAFRRLVADAPAGSATFSLSGLPALPQATFTATSLAPATQTDFSLGVDPQASDVYGAFPGTGKQFVLFPNVYEQGVDSVAQGSAFIVEVAASAAPLTVLYAGIDSNGDGKPSQNEQACQSTAASGSSVVGRCVVDLRGAGAVNVWALVDIPSGSVGANYAVSLRSGIPALRSAASSGLVAQQLHVVGPGHVDAQAVFALRTFWGPAGLADTAAPIPPGTSFGAILIDAFAGGDFASLGQAGLVPLSITRSGSDDVADALPPGASRTLVVGPGETLSHVFIDLPGNATSLSVTASESGAGGAAAALSFYAVRADFPAAALSPQVAAAPAPPGAASWSIGGAVSQKTVVIPASGGRWYIVATNPGASEATFTLATQVAVNTTAASPLQAGNYFNPQRGGHGIFLSQASGQQVVDWYTFLEDGTPTWYLAQNGAPAAGSGVWSSTLYRAAWDGSGGTPTPVGDVTLTATSADHAMFSWHLYGQGGSEAFELLARPECVDAGGSVNLNGEWYPPALAGIGFDALVIPGQQFDAFYLYDDGGNPRWVVGAQGPFAASATVPMLQATGFCPLCAWQSLTTKPAGSLTVAYANASSGQLSAAITLQAPLSGTWSFDQPIARLTGAAGCP